MWDGERYNVNCLKIICWEHDFLFVAGESLFMYHEVLFNWWRYLPMHSGSKAVLRHTSEVLQNRAASNSKPISQAGMTERLQEEKDYFDIIFRQSFEK